MRHLTVAECRQYAVYCKAQYANLPTAHDHWLDMADEWDRLADDQERRLSRQSKLKAVLPSPTRIAFPKARTFPPSGDAQ
jgi:hypothetical protein